MSIREGGEPDIRGNARGEDAEPDGVVLEVTDLHAGYGEVPVLHGVSLSALARAKRSASSATTAWARRRC